jgi:hypothetical protein
VVRGQAQVMERRSEELAAVIASRSLLAQLGRESLLHPGSQTTNLRPDSIPSACVLVRGDRSPPTVFVINQVCRLIVKRKGMEVSVGSGHQPGAVGVDVLPECFEARLSGLAKARVKESSMRVKKRVKKGVKKGIKSVKSAPPEAYLAGVGVLVGGAAVLLLATNKSGQELLLRTAQLVLRPEADDQKSQESDVQEDVHNEPAEDADVEEEPEKDTNGDDESEVTDRKPRNQRPRGPRKAPALRKATNA